MYGLESRVAVSQPRTAAVTIRPPARSSCQTSDLVREAGNVLLADVCEQQVDQVVACLGLGALRRACNAAAVQGLVEVSHLDELVLDVGSLCRAVPFRQPVR